MIGSRSLPLLTLGLALSLGACNDDGADDAADTNATNGTDATGADTGGSEESTGTPSTDLSFAEDIQPIIDATCVSECHETGGHWFYLDLTGNAYDRLVGEKGPTQAITMNLVEPGSLEESYLWHKLNGTHEDVAPGTLQMPVETDDPPGTVNATYMTVPLPQADLDTIEEWIVGGAPP